MNKLMIIACASLFLIVCQTSDSTYSYNDGNGNTGVVVVN